jgi:phosphate:Na+ symporter
VLDCSATEIARRGYRPGTGRHKRRGLEDSTINGTDVLLGLLGSAALLLWGLRMVKTGVLRAYGAVLRRRLGASMENRFAALLAGLGITLALQSSTATALMAASFAGRGLVGTGAALAVMLGADVGTSLVAQALSFDIHWLSPLLILAGVAIFMSGRATRFQDVGRLIVGLGLMLLSLRQLTATAVPLRESMAVQDLLAALAGEPVLAVLVAAVLTVLSASSLAVVLLVIALVSEGAIGLPLAYALVLGANLGGGITPILATSGAEPRARRVPLGNFLFRLTGVIVALPLLGFIAEWLAAFEPAPERQIANLHTVFNIALAVVFLPWIGPMAKFLERIWPDRPEPEESSRPRYLDPSAIDTPSVAIASAARETLRLGDIVAEMLRKTMEVFRTDDRRLMRDVEHMDDTVDRLQETIKLYLTKVSRESLDPEESRRCIDVITFTTNLEHIGDIIDKNLMELAAKKIKNRLQFSAEGFSEIVQMHERLMDNFKLALNVFIAGDPPMARRLIAEKVQFREMERAASESHLARLRSGKIESLETSALHLDVLRDLKRINSHLTSVAYPILEGAGELAESRLKQQA